MKILQKVSSVWSYSESELILGSGALSFSVLVGSDLYQPWYSNGIAPVLHNFSKSCFLSCVMGSSLTYNCDNWGGKDGVRNRLNTDRFLKGSL